MKPPTPVKKPAFDEWFLEELPTWASLTLGFFVMLVAMGGILGLALVASYWPWIGVPLIAGGVLTLLFAASWTAWRSWRERGDKGPWWY